MPVPVIGNDEVKITMFSLCKAMKLSYLGRSVTVFLKNILLVWAAKKMMCGYLKYRLFHFLCYCPAFFSYSLLSLAFTNPT